MEEAQAAKPETHPDKQELKDMIACWAGPEKVPDRLKIVTDTSDFFKVDIWA